MLWIIAIVNFIYAPLMIFLRNPPGKDEKQVRDTGCLFSPPRMPTRWAILKMFFFILLFLMVDL